MTFNITRSLASAVIDDSPTRLIIPTKQALVTGLIGGITSSIRDQLEGSTIGSSIESLLSTTLNTTLLDIGVTGIEIEGNMINPRSKGIGSIGEVMFLMGSELEDLTIEFATERFPGPASHLLYRLIRDSLDYADIVYIVDDMVGVAPCIITKYKIKKVGKIKHIVKGRLTFAILRTKDFSGLQGAIQSGLLSLTASAISNLFTDLPHEFSWLAEVLRQKWRL